MGSTLESLLKKPVIILDGATGTELIAKGLSAGECPDQWNITHPDAVKDVHRSYFSAGSDIVYTNTFGANRMKLISYGLENDVASLNRAAAENAREVCPEGCLVGGDIGPTGKFLKPTGQYTPEELEEVFREQASALRDGGVDLISIETMFDLQEAKIALRAALQTKLPVFVTLTFNKKKRGFFTLMGNSPSDSFKALREEGATAAGANCGIESNEMLEMVETLEIMKDFPLIMKPNAGNPKIEGDKTVYKANPDLFAEFMERIFLRGVRIIGGCCGTSPLFIGKIAARMKNRAAQK